MHFRIPEPHRAFSAVLFLLAMLFSTVNPANAYYSCTQGRFISRDPIGTSSLEPGLDGTMGSVESVLRVTRRGNGSEESVSDLNEVANTPVPPALLAATSHVPGPHPDGPNLYLYARSSPSRYTDPQGTMSEEKWNKCCKDTGLADKQAAAFREAAKKIDGYEYGSIWRGEWGCGWCAMNILSFVSSVKTETPDCWTPEWVVAQRFLSYNPPVLIQHQFVILIKRIDDLGWTDRKNRDSPVFDGWGGASGNLKRKCKFSESTVGAYRLKWWFWRKGGE
jgi:hypothetical protein